MQSPRAGTTVRCALVVASLAGTLVALGGPALAADGVRLGIAPADEPSYFHSELIAGAMTRRAAVVSNHSSTVQKIAIYPADGLTTPQGGFSVKPLQEPRRGIGAWAKLPMTTLTLRAGEQRRVSFELTVPVGTAPGDYSGGIVVQSQPRVGNTAQLGRQTAVQLNLVERVVARVYLRVAGIARPALTLGTLAITGKGSTRDFAVTVTNTGNLRLQPGGSLRLDGRPGSAVEVKLSAVDALLPGQQAVLRGRWTHVPTLFWGQATATVRSEAGVAKARTPLHVIPVVAAAIAFGLLLAMTWAAVRTIGFLRRARAALRAQLREPLMVPLVPAFAGPGHPGKHRHLRP